jgi:hypothetical protein
MKRSCHELVAKRLFSVLLLSAAPVLQAANNPVPFLDQTASPTAVPPGHAAFTLTLTGGGFVSGSVVNWNGTPLATHYISNRKVTATVPAALVAAPQTGSVKVVNSAPGGGASNTVFIAVSTPTTLVSYPNYNLNSFETPTSVVATADLNGDGKADVVFAADEVLYVMYGNGDGTFGAPVSYPAPAGQEVGGIAIGDFNGDSIPDIAVGTAYGGFQGQVYILFGTAEGSFVPGHSSYRLANYTSALSTADLNGDGNLDLVAGFMDGGVVSVLLGNGDGTFGPATDYATGGSPAALVLADFNNDGIVDIAVSNTLIGTTSILLGNGDGTFRAGGSMQVLGAHGITAGDFNHDGNVDLAIESNFYVSIYLGNGDGKFKAPIDTPETDIYVASVITGDFNSDGNLDLALVYVDEAPEIFLGNGDGTFQTGVQAPLTAGSDPVALAAADFNQDGRLDLVSANNQEGVSIFLSSTLSVSTTTVGFSYVLLGSSSGPMNIDVENFGSTPINLGPITLTGTSPSEYSFTTTCGSTLAAGTTCTVSITFTPTAVGFAGATLTIPNSTLGISQFVTLSGDGLGVTLTPATLNFGTVAVGQSSPPQTVTFDNVGSTALTIKTIAVNNSSFSETNNCGKSVGPGASCTISVTFRPESTGPISGGLGVTFIGIGSPQSVRLTGTGQ